VLARLEVHRAELPALGRVLHPILEAPLLLLVVDGEPVFDHDDAGAHEHLLELGARSEKLLVLLGRAEPHDALDAGAIVPAAIEEDDLPRRRQLRHVALEVPLPLLALGGGAEGDDPTDPGVQALGDALDDAALPGRVAPLEDHHDLEASRPDPLLQLHELELELRQLADEVLLLPLPLGLRVVLLALLLVRAQGLDAHDLPRVLGDLAPDDTLLLALLLPHARLPGGREAYNLERLRGRPRSLDRGDLRG
jgi:hypothetical protein